MTSPNRSNEFGQAIGAAIPDWNGALPPPRKPMQGRLCSIQPLNPDEHGDDLYAAFADDPQGSLWTYMSVGPFGSKQQFSDWLRIACTTEDPLFHAIVDSASNKASGLAAYMRIKPGVGVIEIGSITYSPRLQKTPTATEAMFLFMQRVFDELKYRRYEWKCDSLNAPSRKAAERLGFSFDGIFEQAIVYKGRNRDTAWYSILDRDWPALRKAYRDWLDPDNFDAAGQQKRNLQSFTSMHRGGR